MIGRLLAYAVLLAIGALGLVLTVCGGGFLIYSAGGGDRWMLWAMVAVGLGVIAVAVKAFVALLRSPSGHDDDPPAT